MIKKNYDSCYLVFSNTFYRQKPSTNTSTLSVASPHGGLGSIAGDHTSNTNIAIEEVNSNASGTDE